jgi:tRNA/rRNA methyltransferase
LCHAQQPKRMSLPLRDYCVVLVRTSGPVNLGMIARLCGNLGIDDLRLVNPLCEINCAETRMFSTHSKDFLLSAPVFPDLPAALHDCTHAIGTSARVRRADAGESLAVHDIPDFRVRRRAGRTALVFGNESDGLSDAEMIQCQGLLHLETFGPNYSYNLSQAVGITLYSLATTIKPSSETASDGARREQVDYLYQYWLETLDRFHYFRKTDRKRFAPQLRRLFNRIDLSDQDVQLLWGMMAQFHYFAFGDRGPAAHAVEKMGKEKMDIENMTESEAQDAP